MLLFQWTFHLFLRLLQCNVNADAGLCMYDTELAACQCALDFCTSILSLLSDTAIPQIPFRPTATDHHASDKPPGRPFPDHHCLQSAVCSLQPALGSDQDSLQSFTVAAASSRPGSRTVAAFIPRQDQHSVTTFAQLRTLLWRVRVANARSILYRA